MPGYPAPVGRNGVFPAHWNAFLQKLQQHSQSLAQLVAGQGQGNIIDANGNVVEVAGTSLSQTVTIGAAFQQPGVQVMTGLTGSGRAKQTGLATGRITVTAGSTAATLVSTASGTFANGQEIGAANIADPSSGTPTPAIVPGTTFTITGSAITLSQAAAESGSGIYAAACTFTRL